MRLAPVLFLLASLVGASCSDGGPDDEGAPASGTPAEVPPMGNPPMGGPDASAVRPGVPLSELLDGLADARALRTRLNEPVRTEAEAVPKRHVPGQTDTVRTLAYDGLALRFYEVAGGPSFLQEVRVTDEGYETAEGLGVGSTREEVEAVHPRSAAAEGSLVTYESGSDDPTPTTFEVRYEGDRVAALTWRFYVD